MNTLRDTDEGKARPSVWPVYLTAGVIGYVTLSHLHALTVHWAEFYCLDMLVTTALFIYVLFGILTCWGGSPTAPVGMVVRSCMDYHLRASPPMACHRKV